MRKVSLLKLALPIALLVVLGACRDEERSDAAENNAVPTIAGVPPTTAVVGQSYEFAPEADDSDDDVLTFVISNRPV